MISEENQLKPIVFIGFMGVGKSSIGKLVATKLEREFYDVDEEIEKLYKMPVTTIFELKGEKAFRESEKALISKLCRQKGLVISVGGGAFLQEEIRALCLSSCIVVFLDISFEKWTERLNLIIDSRPVLHGKSIEEMLELFNKRQANYSNHHLKINCDNMDIEKVADQIVTKLEQDFDSLV